MATLSDLKEVKEALDAGLVSQAEFDKVKRDYLRAKEEASEFQKKELRAKEEALEFQKKELRAKEEALEANKEIQKRKAEAELRTFARESIVKQGSSIMSDSSLFGWTRTPPRSTPAAGRRKAPAAGRRKAPAAGKRNSPATAKRKAPAAGNQVAAPGPSARGTPPPPAVGASTSGSSTQRLTLVRWTPKMCRPDNYKEIFGKEFSHLNKFLMENAEIITEDWLERALPKSKKYDEAKTRRLFEEAASRGYLSVFKNHAGRYDTKHWNDRTFVAAIKSENLDLLEFFRKKNTCRWTKKGFCEYAAQNGHLDALKWLRRQDDHDPCPWDEKTCSEAAKNGHLDALKWMRSQDDPCPWDQRTCSEAAAGKHLDVLKWLRSQDPPCPWNEETCHDAASIGDLNLLKWLRSQDPPCPWGVDTCTNAAYNGHLDVLKWLIDNGCPYDVNSYVGRSAYEKLGLA